MSAVPPPAFQASTPGAQALTAALQEQAAARETQLGDAAGFTRLKTQGEIADFYKNQRL